jgi:large subunit ribosomal protein L4
VATLTKYNLVGEKLGDVAINDELYQAEANGQMIKDYIVALRNNARQWTASTKTRAEVKHTTKKPSPQKGQGRARHGSLVGPQYRGGGRVHTPRPKFDQHVKINLKEKRAAIRCLIAEKLRDNMVILIADTKMEAPKTKMVANFMKHHNLIGRRTLFLGESHFAEMEVEDFVFHINLGVTEHDHFIKSARNVPKSSFKLATNVSGYDVLSARYIVLTEAALNELTEWLI